MTDAARHPSAGRRRLVVAGAGVAGLEALVALHTLAPARFAVTLVDPGSHFRLRALDVGEPFGLPRARRYPLTELARDLGAALIADQVHRVDHEGRAVVLGSGRRVEYDVLLLAVGARPYPALSEGVLFDPAHGRDVLERLAADPAGHTAVVVPPGVGWTLPAYELALLLSTQPGAVVTLVTAETAPLEVFGRPGTALAREELETAGVALVTGARAIATSPTRVRVEGRFALDVDRIVHLPRHVGAGISGVRCNAAGFVVTGPNGAVAGMDGVFAAGDGTSGAIKHGGLAAQQGDAAAQAIAALAGVAVDAAPSETTLRGVLRTPSGPRYLQATASGGEIAAEVSRHPLWWPPTKVASAWLTPWLTTRDAHCRRHGAPPPRPVPAERAEYEALVRRVADRPTTRRPRA
jgi:sulfide:quinone oxidoreductase